MTRVYMYLAGLFIFSHVAAQTGQITGKVFDATSGNTLSGASVQIEGAGVTTSAKDGTFSFPCRDSAQLTISIVGYQTHKQLVKNCAEALTINMKQASYNLNEVEITTTTNPNKALLYQPLSITKLGAPELTRGQGLYLDDAINQNIPGVFMEKRAVSSGQEFNIRGYGNGVGSRGANNNFDGQGSKVYLNGIPITDAEGITLMDDIDFSSIGNVEVTKGPAGSLYGLAVAGVVNLKTIQPEKGKTSIGQEVMFGSYGLQKYTTHFAMATDKASLLVNYGHQKSNGYMPHNASHKDFVNVFGEFKPNSKQTINTYFGYSDSYDQRAGELTIGQYDTMNYSGNPDYIKRNAHSEIVSFRGGLGHTYAFDKHFSNTSTVFATGVFNNSSSAAGWTDKTSVNYGLRSTLDIHYALKKGWGISGLVGVEAQQQNAQIIGYNMVIDSAHLDGYYKLGATKSNQLAITGTWSLLSELTVAMPYDFSLTVGAGMSSMNIKLNDRFYVATSKNPTTYGANYNNLISPKVSINKVFKKQFSVYASYSRGYKAPTSSNIFISATGAINTGLKAERGDQFEIGTKGALVNNRLYYEVALYDAIFTNKMMAVAVPLNASTTAYTYTANGGKQDDKGIEALVKVTAYESPKGIISVRPYANFCYSYFRYVNYSFQALSADKMTAVIMDYNGKAVAGVSPITANVGVDLSFKYGFYANLNYSYRSAMPITSDGVYYTSAYSLLNTKVGFQHTFFKHLGIDVFFGVNNITGTQYYQMVFLNQIPDAYLPAPPKANFYGGIAIKGIL